ncbi:RNA-binding S4 domain-containing protein [Streptomyces sp. AJS327]|uniref:RNA-binding S4 domain-containing protein n=1 Tax=Streptomyces sp. AJS327 TaxID=2545265 RepID=UPI0015E020FD|nr:RNA-binding S4 domain-containing protein [Streptomyces sp. AJS327]MBA0051182.1 RNA-binding S4 domain-containing protein [Streptomyces sp. AJS327]
MASGEETARVDTWIWSVRLVKTRALAAKACRAGHVKVNGKRAKPAQTLRGGDEVRVRQDGRERVAVVTRLLHKRVGAAIAAECYVDQSPPPPPPLAVAPDTGRERAANRHPTQRELRELARLRSGG